MIVTNKFVFINLPKTGSTFVRSVLQDVSNNCATSRHLLDRMKKKFNLFDFKANQISVPMIRNSKIRTDQPDPHGICDQIPKNLSHLPIISVYRDPLTKIKSAFAYGDWKKVDYWDKNKISREFPNFPDLTLNEFVRLFYSYNPALDHDRISANVDIGPHTAQFVKFFFRSPFDVLNHKISDEYFYSNKYLKDMYSVKFFKFENLKDDLECYLDRLNIPKRHTMFIKDVGKINQSKSDEETLTESSKKTIKYKERYLYHIASNHGFFTE